MKKLLLSIGALAAVVAPVASVIACGSDDDDKTTPSKAETPGNVIKTTAQSTKTAAELKSLNIVPTATQAQLAIDLGVDASEIPTNAAVGATATYAWDKATLTLTLTSKLGSVEIINELKITPKAAETPWLVVPTVSTKPNLEEKANISREIKEALREGKNDMRPIDLAKAKYTSPKKDAYLLEKNIKKAASLFEKQFDQD